MIIAIERTKEKNREIVKLQELPFSNRIHVAMYHVLRDYFKAKGIWIFLISRFDVSSFLAEL